MSSDDKVILTAEQAIALLPEGEFVHNYVNPGAGMLIGCDFERASAIEAFEKALQIELGGDNCKAMKHPIIAWDTKNHYSFFQADMDKVRAFEETLAAAL